MCRYAAAGRGDADADVPGHGGAGDARPADDAAALPLVEVGAALYYSTTIYVRLCVAAAAAANCAVTGYLLTAARRR